MAITAEQKTEMDRILADWNTALEPRVGDMDRTRAGKFFAELVRAAEAEELTGVTTRLQVKAIAGIS